ncbi:MAG: hypothetical protein JWQ49_6686 [Edaphobacter sp.]|nr:hypothetical protein [Edaphobacter sp.]
MSNSIMVFRTITSSLLLLFSMSHSVAAASVSPDPADEKLGVAVHDQCSALRIECPVTEEALHNEVTRAFAEQAVENVLRTQTRLSLVSGIRKDRLVVRVTRYPIDSEWTHSPEAQKTALDAKVREENELRDLPVLLQRLVATMFQKPLLTSIDTIGNTDETALNSLGAATLGSVSPDVIGASSRRIDFSATWNRVINAVRQAGYSINQELQIDKNTGKRRLQTVPVANSDNEWLYQSFQEISLWDPSFGDRTASGSELRIEVVLIAGRRKRLNPNFDYISRPGPGQDELLSAILKAIEKHS